MKKTLMMGVIAALLATAAAPAQADDDIQDRFDRSCSEGYTAVRDLNSHKVKCSGARKVLRKWMGRPIDECPLDGKCRLRIGRVGVLWSCYGSRSYGQLNPYHVQCFDPFENHYVWFDYTHPR
jgi:hypothetical protein